MEDQDTKKGGELAGCIDYQEARECKSNCVNGFIWDKR
jgi:hypothetical protein